MCVFERACLEPNVLYTWCAQHRALRMCYTHSAHSAAQRATYRPSHQRSSLHPGGNPGANLKSISHRCHPILLACVWDLTEETINLPWAVPLHLFAQTRWRQERGHPEVTGGSNEPKTKPLHTTLDRQSYMKRELNQNALATRFTT